jgi:gamma-glutamylcyclotransferase (GGCT)/AIG2-like uncharacterized protein YtfP
LSQFIFTIGDKPLSDATLVEKGFARVSAGYLPDQGLFEVPATSIYSPSRGAPSYRLARQRNAVVTGTIYLARGGDLGIGSDRAEQAFDDQGNFRSVKVMDLAINNQATRFIDQLFIYGTLMKGQCREQYLPDSAVVARDSGTCHGRLFDTGNDYPALQWPDSKTTDLVSGELLRCKNLSELLESLDDVEGFLGYDRTGNLYDRRLVPVRTVDQTVLAWTYTDAGMHPNMTLIPSGCWRTRQRSNQT